MCLLRRSYWRFSFALFFLILANKTTSIYGYNNNNNPTKQKAYKNSSSVTTILIFGDSTVDPGNNNYIQTISRSNFPPYGVDFPNHASTGRFTNGKLTTDFIASYIGIKEMIPAYLDPNLSLEDLLTGVSFASAGTGYDHTTAEKVKVLSLEEELGYFDEYKEKLEQLVGKSKMEDTIKHAIFIVSCGSNDIIYNFGLNVFPPLPQQVHTYLNLMRTRSRWLLEALKEKGARAIVIVGVPPVGCLPVMKTLHASLYEPHSCVEYLSSMAVDFNKMLQQDVNITQASQPNSIIVYVDIYGPLYDQFTNPSKYGFTNWKRAMKLSLSARNKLGFVNGKISKPIEGTLEFDAWERCNDLVTTWLINSLDDAISKSIMFLKSATDVWNNLESRFGFISLTELFSLEHKLAIVNQGANSISEFFTAIKTIWDAIEEADPVPICACNGCSCNITQKNLKRQERRMLLQFMMKLKDDYAPIRGNILMMKPVPDVTEAYRIFAQEESHRTIVYPNNSQHDSLAFYADNRKFNVQIPRYPRQNFSTNKGGSSDGYNQRQSNFLTHKGSAGDNSNQRQLSFRRSERPTLFCSHCKMNNHTVDRCYKLHGFPNDWSKNKRVAAAAQVDQDQVEECEINGTVSISADQYNQFMEYMKSQDNVDHTGAVFDGPGQAMLAGNTGHAMLAGKFCFLALNNAQWLIDSGASDHMCSDIGVFSSYHAPLDGQNNYITIPNGSKIAIKYVGTVKLNDDITLKNVLYVPDFKFNLISVNKMCQDLNCGLYFTHDKCIVCPQKGSSILLGELTTGLYRVIKRDARKAVGLASKKSCISSDEAKLWHLRLGHMPFSQMKHMNKDFDVQSSLQDSICQICPQARQSKLPFSYSSIKTNRPFEMIHVDTWGPLKFKTHTGCTLFLTIVDDFSRFTWVHFMKHKNDAVNILINFASFVKTQFGLSISCLRSDNAKEFCEGPIKKFYEQFGVVHQTSCSETPEQNGVVERKHRHLLETTRALYLQSRVPDSFWGECVKCAVFLINRMPLKTIHFLTPYEKLYGNKPDLSVLRAFGCLCYVYTSKVNRHKLAPRASPSVFLGYSVTQKGYLVLDLKTRLLKVSRNVKFFERHFPFQLHLKASQSVNDNSHLYDIYLPAISAPGYIYETEVVSPEVQQDTTSVYSQQNSSFLNSMDNIDTGSLVSDSVQLSGMNQDVFNISEHNTDGSSIAQQLVHDDTASIVVDFSSYFPTQNAIVDNVRRSTRVHNPPKYLHDYKCYNATSHWCNLVHYNSFPLAYRSFLAQVCEIKEPENYVQASKEKCWVEAMEKELKALHDNKTWVLTSLPYGKKPIGSKWVYKVKLKADGSLERCKARLVAQGFRQKQGVDYSETFSPVVKMSTIRSLLSLAAARQWKVFQLDVNNAFLHGDLQEEVYMKVPEGVPNPLNQVCKLVKSLYGLKQASRQWFAKLVDTLVSLGFRQSRNDYSLFTKKYGNHICVVAVYVDDILLTGSDVVALQDLKLHLHNKFSIKDLGELNYFLGMEVQQTSEGFLITQNKFTRDLLKSCELDLTKKASTPLPLHLKLQADTGVPLSDPARYRTLVGKLNFLTNTRPDLAFAVQSLSQYMQAPTTIHQLALQHTLRYVADSVGQGILLCGSDELKLQAFCDADWAACADSRRSVTGYVIMLGRSPISWKSKKQSIVSRSSAESEYRAMANASSEVAWLVRLLEELGVNNLRPVTLHCDSQSALHIAKNPVFHERTKHIEIDCHFTRDKVLEGLLQLSYLPTKSQLADVFTKTLCSPQLKELLGKLGMQASPI